MGQHCNTFLNNTQKGPDGVRGRAQLVHMSPGDMEECCFAILDEACSDCQEQLNTTIVKRQSVHMSQNILVVF